MPMPHDQWLRHVAQLDARDAHAPVLAPLGQPPERRLDLHPDFDVAAVMEPQLESSRRTDGWTAARQTGFLSALAAGASIESAAKGQGLSASSAYSFRNSAKGAAFGIGWVAAQLLQRQRLADTVAARAFDGQTITITRPDGSTHERHYHDNRLAMSVLARLDRLAAGHATAGTPITGEAQAARLAAAEWDRYLDILRDPDGSGPARAGLFLAARTADSPSAPELAALTTLARADLYDRTGAGVVAEIDTTDLDPATRAAWTADQWARAEAAGLLVLAPAPVAAANDMGDTPHSQHSPASAEPDDDPVWWCEVANEWRTSFPPPQDFDGEQDGRYGDPDYARGLTLEEEEMADLDLDGPCDEPATVPGHADHVRERDAWFAAAAAHRDAARESDPPDAEAPLFDWPPSGGQPASTTEYLTEEE